MLSGFSGLQVQETRVASPAVAEAGIDWLLELAPLNSPSPALSVPRLRLLLDERGWRWPVCAEVCPLPFADDSLPAVMMRYLVRPGVDATLLDEVHRCLVPGGALVLVAANPFHPRCWREAGREVLRLPGRWRLVMRLRQLGFEPAAATPVVGLSPVWVMCVRKAGGAGRVQRVRFEHRRSPVRSLAAGSTCRAA